MARNMITGIETQKMQEYTQEQIDRAEHMGIAIPADVKEQIFEYANLVGEEEKVRTLVRNLADAVNRSDEDRVEELLDDAQMDIQDLPDPTIGKLELRDYGYTAEDMVPLRKAAALDYHRMGSKIYCLGSDGSKGEYASKEMIQAHEGLFGMHAKQPFMCLYHFFTCILSLAAITTQAIDFRTHSVIIQGCCFSKRHHILCCISIIPKFQLAYGWIW